MSDLQATVAETKQGFHVEGYEKIEYDFTFLDGVFHKENAQLAGLYERWGRVLAVMDANIFDVYGSQIQEYFDHHKLELQIHKTMIGEKAKSMDTLLSIVDSMNKFGIYRKEPVLVVGGGLVTDVAGFACAAYRRNTNYIRVPTTVIGLIDASVSIKVAVNYGNYKNRLGAYHAPIHTFLDFTFLRTLPVAQIRNGFAELIKISTCAHLRVFDLLDKYCEQLINTGFGRSDDAPQEVKVAAEEICRSGIHEMLKLETPNLHEIGLDRIIAFGHTWSPLHELVPDVPLRHGHAISIDMAYSSTLAHKRGLINDTDYKRILDLFSRAGLSMDHPDYNEHILDQGTKAILKTRDGKLRLAVPSPLGSCVFVNDVPLEEMVAALKTHKEVVAKYPRKGAGLDAFVDASDTGYTVNAKPIENEIKTKNIADKSVINNDVVAAAAAAKAEANNDHAVNGSLESKVNGHANGHANGINGHANGHSNGVSNGVH